MNNERIDLDYPLIDSTKGFLSKEEGLCLFEMAVHAAPLGPLLEIGSYCGKSAIYMGSAVKPFGQILFSIDHHKGSEEHQPGESFFDPELFDAKSYEMNTFPSFRRTISMAGLEDTVVPIVSKSRVVAGSWKTPLSLVFIDGGHAFDTVHTDYTCWEKHICKGGYLLFHDIYEDPNVGGQAPFEVYKIAIQSPFFHLVKRVNSLAVLKKEA